ncbi:MAG: phosphoglycerate kinase [Patescibacteria group bacterium]
MHLRDIRTVKDLAGKRVLVRVDFNVPLRQAGSGYEVDPHGDWRIRRSLPTIMYLMERGAVVILLTHVGRPKGMVREDLRVKPMAMRLSMLLNEEGIANELVWTNFERHVPRGAERQLLLASDCVGTKTIEVVDHAREGDIVMLENVRFQAGEEANDVEFAKALAEGKDIYVNDQLGMSHRAHASVSAVTSFVPSYAGMLLIDEVQHLSAILNSPQKPFVFILGGVKLETKLPLLRAMLPRVDVMHIGGAAANTLLSAVGKPVGRSMVTPGHDTVVNENGWEKVRLPVDVVVAKDTDGIGVRTCKVEDVRPDEYIYDVGPETVDAIRKDAQRARLVVWNGPLGYFEVPLFAQGSTRLARELAVLNTAQTETVVGGGDTEDLVESVGMREKMRFVSTGGGAMLAFLSGEELPGLVPLLE